MLQTEMATAASRAAERCSLMKVEVQRCQEEMEKQRMTIEALKRDRHCQSEREEELRQEVKVCQDKFFQKEQLLSSLQQELGSAQALAGEVVPLKHLCQQLQAERASLESKHREDLEQRAKATTALQAELARARVEVAELPALRDRAAEQERALQRLQKETASSSERLAALQAANSRLAEENRALSESVSRGQQRLDAELGQAREKHTRELECVRLEAEKAMASSRQEAEEAARKLEAMSNKYENTKVKVLEERQKFQEERQKLMAQVGAGGAPQRGCTTWILGQSTRDGAVPWGWHVGSVSLTSAGSAQVKLAQSPLSQGSAPTSSPSLSRGLSYGPGSPSPGVFAPTPSLFLSRGVILGPTFIKAQRKPRFLCSPTNPSLGLLGVGAGGVQTCGGKCPAHAMYSPFPFCSPQVEQLEVFQKEQAKQVTHIDCRLLKR